MGEVMYRYEVSAATLEYILKVLGTRPHDEVRPVIDQLLRGRMEQDQERNVDLSKPPRYQIDGGMPEQEYQREAGPAQ